MKNDTIELRLENVPEIIGKEKAIDCFSKLIDFANNSKQEKLAREKIRATENIMITEITKKYDFYHKLLAATFIERQAVIEKGFEVIDKGIREHDNELISVGLKNVADIVQNSPFKNIAEFHQLLESNRPIEL